jgi:hypothetical protein
MLSKNLPLSERLYKLPFRFALDGINAWKDMLSGNPTTLKAVFFSHVHTIEWWFNGKKNKQNKTPITSLNGVYKGSIVWQYFVKKKTKFTEIM